MHSLLRDAQLARNFTLRQAPEVQAEYPAGSAVVAFAGLRMSKIIVENFGQAFEALFAVRGAVAAVEMFVEGILSDAIINDVERGELGIVVGDKVTVAVVLPIHEIAVEGDEGLQEIAGLGMRRAFAERDVDVVEQIFVEDALALENSDDIGLVAEVCLGELFGCHNSNISGLDMW